MNSNDRSHPAPGAATHKNSGERSARLVEYSVALFLTAAAVAMHVRYFLDAGGLWRDEITSVNLANTNPLSRAIANLHADSFPILWLLVVRFWERSGLGASDRGMRVLGLLAGIAVLAVLWRNARRFGRTAPVIALALFGFTSAVICYGDSIRAYGLGMFLGLLTMGLIWEMTRKQTWASFVAALIAAMLSVHMLFYNSVLLFAACCGAFAVMVPKKQWRLCRRVMIIGVICAGSMLVYVPMVQHTRDYRMFQTPLNLATLIYNALASLEFVPDGGVAPGLNAVWWSVAAAAAMLVALVTLVAAGFKPGRDQRRDAVVFCAVNLVVGVVGYGAFLKILSYRMQPWYFLAAMALVAGSLDGLLAGARSPVIRLFAAICATGFALNAASPVWNNVGVRRTNVDLLAGQVEHLAVKGDVIVMAPWNIGCTFLRYYHGPAKVTAIPPVGLLDYQRFDLLEKFMKNRKAMDPLIDELSQTLHEGHRVFVVGDRDFPSRPPASPYFQERPDPVYGWLTPYYQKTWQDQVGYALRHDSSEVVLLSTPTDRPVSHLESSFLSVVLPGKADPSVAR